MTEYQKAVNVLELGAKNDGSEDVSEIVNRYTKETALYFPAGQYKVSQPLVIENPIFGAGYARGPQADAGHTWLISEIQHEDTDPLNETGVIRFGGTGHFTVENLNIRCASHECGIYINPCVQSTATFVNKVGIYNMRGYGLLATKGPETPGFASRPLFLQNMTIFGTADYPYPCVGIQLDDRIGDNRFANIEIMGTRIGVVQEASFVYATNMHIWTGCLGQKDNDQWWETTRSIILGKGDANFLGDNIYVDTSYVLIEFRSPRNMLSINNFMSWEDGSIQGCTKRDAKLFKIPEGSTEYPNINLTNGMIYVSGDNAHPGRLNDVTAPCPNARIQNVRILSNYSLNADTWKRHSFLRCDTPTYSGIVPASDADQYVRIAAIVQEANGSCELTYTADNGDRADFTLATKGSATRLLMKKGIFCDAEFYDKFEEKFCTLYVKVPANSPELHYTVKTTCASECYFPLDLGLLKNHPAFTAKTEILSSADDLGYVSEATSC
ncbi:MAG: hypothetical protein IKU40_12215 [Clostridia bacterium]|nr:hypothetical protein [Clostridia bacterium]